MAEPKIADTRPMVLELEPGTYFWCSCGHSSNQPYCDGSHKGSEFTPMKFEVEETKRLALCLCKRTGGSPMCDGSHKGLT